VSGEKGPVMDKAPDAYRTISEVAEDLDLPQHVLRFWETRFGQIKPLKRGGGRRYYRPDDVELLKGIRHLLYKEGYTIKGVQRILKEQGAKAVQTFVRDSLSEALPVSPGGPETDFPPAVPPVPARQPAMTLVPPAPVADIDPDEGPDPDGAADLYGQGLQDQGLQDPALDDAGSYGAAPPPVERPEPTVVPAAPPDREKPAPLANPQVSMFRGGLRRAEMPVPEAAPAPASLTTALSPAASAREALLLALDELQACRMLLDRALAERRGASTPGA
jgi:DNA-binding transcriptional MerR regulator